MSHSERLTETLERSAGRPFLIDAESALELSHGEARGRAAAIAAALAERGVRRGDRVGLALPNSLSLALLYLAALRAGYVAVPLGSGFGRRELRSILGRAEPRIVLSAGQGDAGLGTVAGELGVPLLEVAVGEGAPGGGAGEPFDPLAAGAVDDGALAAPADDDVCAIHFTSGTTGTPRGVVHRVRDFLANAERFAAATGLDSSHRFHHTLPMTYMAGYYNLLLLPLALGASVVVDRAFEARSLLRYWDAATRHEADVHWFVPTIMAMLLQLDRGEEGVAHCRERVRFAAVGTAPLDAELRARFEQRYGIAVHNSYGLSETLLATSSTPSRPAAGAAVGPPLPGVELELADETGVAVAAGTSGNVRIRCEDTMLGYLEREDSGTARTRDPRLDDGWLDTGDIGRLDGDGALEITGRAKEIIIRGGVNVGPRDVEAALEDHDAVETVVAVGVPHELLGEDIVAVVALADGAALEDVEPELGRRAAERLDATRRPSRYIEIDELPRTPTGKPRRGALRDLVIDRLGLAEAAKGFAVDAPAPAERGAPEAAPGPAGPGVVDLSHPMHPEMTTYPSPNHPRFEVTRLARHATEGRATRRLVLGTHTGTHVDAPLHFIPDGPALDDLALDAFVGPAAIADLTPAEELGEISRERLEAALGGTPAHPRVLLRHGWSAHFDDLETFYERSPYLSREACAWLVEHGTVLLGMDTPSPDDPRLGFGAAEDSPNHHLLLGAGVVLLEYLANLDALAGGETYLVAAPLPVAGADGAPARAIALER